MALRRDILLERLQGSLFFVPLVFVLGGVLLALFMVEVDARVGESVAAVPFFLTSTVDSARATMGTVAAATITVAGIAFSIALLVIQMAASQYSPRVVHGLFRDSFNKRVMGLVLGTFTYCLLVLQSIRGPISDGGDEVVPNLAVTLGLVFGVVAILSVVAFINHNAHAMEVSEILQGVTDQTIDAIDVCWHEPDEAPAPYPEPEHESEGFVVSFDAPGWIQYIEDGALRDLTSPGGTVRFESGVGRYAIEGLPLCTIWPTPTDPEETTARARRAVHLGRTRTLGQDPAYGLRQVADVGIRALSPGVDDPTTAQDAIFHLAALLRRMQCRIPIPVVVGDDQGRCLVRVEADDQVSMVKLAYEELRRSASTHPTVCVYLLEALSLLSRAEDPPPPDDARAAMREQAELVVAGARAAGLIDHDLDLVVEAYEARFGA